MFEKLFSISKDFLSTEQRDKMLVDLFINKKFSFPPKSDIGREIKNIIKDHNKSNNWYFNLDRIEHIKLYYMDNDKPSSFPIMLPSLEVPKSMQYHQKQRKIVAFSKINDNVENVMGGDLYIKSFDGIDLNLTEVSKPGDLIIFPSFVPFNITPVGKNERAVYLQCIIQGLSFR